MIRKQEEEEKEEEKKEEEETEEVDTEEEKKLEKIISAKLETLVKTIKEEPVKRSKVYKNEPDLEKSVLETDPYLRSKRPFVKLSGKMESFIEDMRSIAKTGIPRSVIKGLTEGTDTEGGFLVPEEFQAEVVRYVSEQAVIRPRARVFNMARDQLTLPKLDQSSDTFAGVTLYWPDEAGSKTESKPAFGKIKLNAKKLVGLCYASDELLEDAAVNVANYLISLFGEAITYQEDNQFIKGTGYGRPLGIINASGINVVGRETSTRIMLEDIVNMYVEHPAWADANAVWLTSKSGIGQLMKMNFEQTTAIAMWMMNLKDNIVPVLQGKPILLTEKVSSLGTAGDIILADLGQYYIGDRGGLKVDTSIHNKFETDETTFRFVKRLDGQPAIAKAFTVLGE